MKITPYQANAKILQEAQRVIHQKNLQELQRLNHQKEQQKVQSNGQIESSIRIQMCKMDFLSKTVMVFGSNKYHTINLEKRLKSI